MITAKVKVTLKTQEQPDGPAQVAFGPDYADGRNQEWALATPSLDLRMTVNGKAADRFEVGKAYTLEFHEES